MTKLEMFIYINIIGFLLCGLHLFVFAMFWFMFMLLYIIIWFFVELPTIFGMNIIEVK